MKYSTTFFCASVALAAQATLAFVVSPHTFSRAALVDTVENIQLTRPSPLFMGEEYAVEQENNAPKKQKKKKTPPATEGETPVIDVSKLDIRVGVITKAWEHEEADKLFCEEIDIGEAEPRQIASGLRAYYKVEDLSGQRVLVLANLKTRKLMGFPSHGMVMCASTEDGSKVEFVEPPVDAKIGERIMVEGYDGEPATENQVIKKKMLNDIFPDLKTNTDGVATYKTVPFLTSAGPCVAQHRLANAEVA
eukprot:scaffold1738_cov46-Attheya_sp.AAC.1